MQRAWLVCVLAGCGGVQTLPADDSAVGSSAALSVDVAVAGGGMLLSAAGPLGQLTAQSTGDEAASAAASATTTYTPPACVIVDIKGNVVTYTFNSCTGPFGLVKLSGTVTATFTPRLGGNIDIAVTSTGLMLNQVAVTLSAQATAKAGTSSTTLTVHSMSSGTSGTFSASHTGDYTATATASCLALDGTFVTTIGGASWTTTITGYSQCSGMCPAAGGTVSVTSQRRTITVHYSSGGTAEVTSSSGDHAMIALSCS